MSESLHLLSPHGGPSILPSLRFEARVLRLPAGDLLIKFVLLASEDGLKKIKWPLAFHRTPSVRRDELWQSTCLEAFVGTSVGAAYAEFNLSPNGDWNIYQFKSYRDGMTKALPTLRESTWREGAQGEGRREAGMFLPLQQLQLVGPVVLGVTAVLEYQDGQKEYWALAHAGEKPDFHLRSSFVVNV